MDTLEMLEEYMKKAGVACEIEQTLDSVEKLLINLK